MNESQPFSSALAYAEQLPGGLDAFPQCASSARLPRQMLQDYPDLVEHPLLPAPWRAAFVALGKLPPSAWSPETHNVLLNHVVFDLYFKDEQDFLSRNKERIIASFSSPLIRSLMRVLTPHLLIMGASRRWGTYHRGSDLVIDKHERQSCEGRLVAPQNLFSTLMLGDTRVALEASIESTRQPVRHIEVRQHTPQEAQFVIQWGTASSADA